MVALGLGQPVACHRYVLTLAKVKLLGGKQLSFTAPSHTFFS